MSFSVMLAKALGLVSRPAIVLIAHLPIILIAAGLLPTLVIGVSVSPQRYAAFVDATIGRLQVWSRHIIVATAASSPDGFQNAETARIVNGGAGE